MDFLYVKLPSTDERADAHRAVHETLEAALSAARLGSLLGWGGSLGEPGAAGARPLRFHRIDVEVGDVDAARRLLQRALDACGVAAGAELHYTKARSPKVDVRGAAGWHTRDAATD